MPSRASEKAPEWVEAYLLPRIESIFRSILKQELSHLEKAMNARFDALDKKLGVELEKLE